MQSVFDQEYSPIEYILIDGGSSDGSRQLLQRRRQDGHRRHAQQRADGVAHQPRNHPCACGITDEENAGRHQEPAKPAHQAQSQGDEERRHRL